MYTRDERGTAGVTQQVNNPTTLNANKAYAGHVGVPPLILTLASSKVSLP